jgi:hypothetical protein
VAVWTTVVVSMAIVLSKGWLAVGDDAAIAIHAYQTFSLHPPLVGVYSTAASAGHVVFDPGPLLFWLMAVPVHVDPMHGLVWGAALAWGVALSLAIEALWWKQAWLGCALVAFTAVDLLCLYPELFENLVWNAYFPIPFLIATIALAWVVATGSFGWWPVLVLVASIAAESHLLFTLPALALALVAAVAGYALGYRPARLRWLTIGAVVAAACWLAPIVQGLGNDGNLVALARSGHGEKALGISFGLRTIATAASPSPIWLKDVPANFFTAAVFISDSSALLGLVALIALTALVALAWWRGHRKLAALALVTLICSLAVLTTFTIFPAKNLGNLGYLIVILWVVGILWWTIGAWAAGLAVAAILRRRSTVDVSTRSRQAASMIGLGSIAVVAVLTLAGLTSLASFLPDASTVGADETGMAAVESIATQIEHRTPKGQVAFELSVGTTDVFTPFELSQGVAWRLKADGWKPGLYGVERSFTGLVPSRRSPAYLVTLDGERLISINPVRCAPLPLGCRVLVTPSTAKGKTSAAP